MTQFPIDPTTVWRKCPQSVHDALGEELTCHLGVLFDAKGDQHGYCPYCQKRTGGVLRNLRNYPRETD